eukprot:symbB.v1.2.000172.t1/scaffold9.1/size550961/28
MKATGFSARSWSLGVLESCWPKAAMAPHQQWLSHKMVQKDFRGWMKEKSVQVPVIKNLLDRPLDLGCVELVEWAIRAAGVAKENWSSVRGNAWRSLKRHGSSPERVLDLLCFLDESSNEVVQKMDLDDITLEHLTAACSALRTAIRKVELAMKLGEEWDCSQGAPWLWYLSASWYLGSEDLLRLQTVDARASILMTRLEHANAKRKQDELQPLKEEESQRQAVTVQMQQLQLECEHLKKRQEESESERLKEESKRQALTLQMQEMQSECESLRKKQEESESERLKEESKRQALTLQMQEMQSECESLRKRQEESERERLKEESKRQELTLQLQQLQLENEKLKKKEFKFKSLVAAAHSLKSKVEQFCNECDTCDAEDASQPDSSWELCTLMTDGSGISIDTAGRCFMREAVFKAALGGFVSGHDLRRGSQILAADGSMVEVAHPPEVSEKRGKVVLQTEKAKLEVTADHRVVNVTHDGEKRQVPAFKLSVGDLVMVDNQTESLTHVDFDPAIFDVLKIGFSPDKLLACTKYCKVFEDLRSTCFFEARVSFWAPWAEVPQDPEIEDSLGDMAQRYKDTVRRKFGDFVSHLNSMP